MKTRAVSAIIAVVLLAGTFWLWRLQGLYVISAIAVLVCIFEYSRLTLYRYEAPLHLRITFFALTAAILFVSVAADRFAVFMTGVGAILFLTMALMTVRKADDLPRVLQIQSMGLLGFVYCGLFPATALRTLMLDPNGTWFFGFLAIVFSGDTFAYLFGRAFGRHKLLEAVSPKKTIEGAMGGLVGSALAGLVLGAFFLREAPLAALILASLVTGVFAQAGDLFESLLKRAADVKDSGAIMPGHGGLLDRLDGVIFAAPIYYALARFLI